MAYKPTAFFWATTCRIGMAHAFQTTVCAPLVGGDIALSYSNASLVNRLEKAVSVMDQSRQFDTQSQSSVQFWREHFFLV